MQSKGQQGCEAEGFDPIASADEREIVSDQMRRDKNKFWIEQPARRFVVYFGVLVTAESLVYGTLHWVFHLL